MNLNVSEWKPFLLKNICKITMGNKMDFVNMTFENPSIAFVGRSDKNNGVADIVDMVIDDKGNTIKPYKAGCVTVALGGTLGASFLQTKDFYTSQNVSVLEFEDCVSDDAKLFITSSIMNECKYKYFPFGRELNTHIRTDFGFNLPIQHNTDGSIFIDDTKKYSDEGYVPDWQFMEDYIKSLHHKPLTTKNKSGQAPDLSVDQWMPFITSRLFYKLENGKANQQMLEDGKECFYVGAKKDDNGVMLHCQKDENLMTRGNCIVFICNGEGSVGFANYMDVDFIGTTDIVAGYNEDLNQYIGMFLATVYSQERPRYSFGRKWKTHLKDTEVKLPVKRNPDGSIYFDKSHKWSDEGYVPDWQFMENYIKALPYGDRLAEKAVI